MTEKMDDYKEKFIKHFTNIGIDKAIANDELVAWLEMMDTDDLDFENPEFDAAECLSYWSD